MGDPSSFVYEDITVKDAEGLKKFFQGGFKQQQAEWVAALAGKPEDEVLISFEGWDEWKLEGYWYEECVQVLKKLANYIEGYAEFEFCGQYHFRICFENGEAYIKSAEPDWEKLPRLKFPQREDAE